MTRKKAFSLAASCSNRTQFRFWMRPGRCFHSLLSTAVVALWLASCHSKEPADLVLLHGRVYKVDSAYGRAQAFAVKDGKIIAVGTDQEISRRYQPHRVIDAMGKAVYPGFIDAHAHFVGYGQSLFAVPLYGCTSFEEVTERVKQFAQAHPDLPWITGRGWDQNKFPGKSFPDNTMLNSAFPATPVVLERVDGHAVIANARALEIAGVQPGQQLTGGEVETKGGRLTGILVDNAQRLVNARIPSLSAADYEQRLVAAQDHCFAQGLTTVTDCGLNRDDIERIDALQKAGKLKMRLYVMISDNKDNLDYYLPKGPYKTDRLYVKGVKAYADGALGSRGACLLQPYDDKPGWVGFLLSNPAHYDSLAKRLVGTDFQLCTMRSVTPPTG